MRIGLTISALIVTTPVVIAAQGSGTPAAPVIPLRVGLTIVKAVEMTTGDAELILRVTGVDADGINITYSGEFLTTNDDNPLGALLGGGAKKSTASSGQLRIRGAGPIADALGTNPGWKLSIEGHTDSIGSRAANMDLSRRRAAAVKGTLVTRHGISGERLTTAGFGSSQPKETNSTLEGRARNRRVELVRQQP